MNQKALVFICASLVLSGCASSLPSSKISLDEKLAKQWSNYEAARQLLLIKVREPIRPTPISRSEWEGTIALSADNALTADDLKTLRARQASQIESMRKKDIEESRIDFNTLRKNHQTAKFCSELPKGGMLHVHGSGTLSLPTIDHLLRTRNPVIDVGPIVDKIVEMNSGAFLSPNELALLKSLPSDKKFNQLSKSEQLQFEKFFFLPYGKQEFPRFNSAFHFVAFVNSDLKTYEEAIFDFAKNAANEHVSYVELTGRFNPEIPAILSRIEKKTHLVIRVNRAFERTENYEALEAKWQKTLGFAKNKFLVGIDFLDNEDINPALEKGQFLYGEALAASISGKTQLHRTMHAGELGDTRNPRDAILMGAERIGHGVALEDDPVTLEYAAKIHMPIEINLSSNLRLTKISKLGTHPFLKYLRLGIPVSLSTDDEGVFEIDINHECDMAINQTDVNYQEIKQMAINSIATSFATPEDKSALLKDLMSSFAKLEARWAKN